MHYLHAPCLALCTHRVTSQRKLALAEPWGLCPQNSFLFRWTDCKMAPFLSFTVTGQGQVLMGPHWQASRFILQGARWFYRLFPAASVVKILLANAGNVRNASSITGSGRSPWRRAQQPTPVFLPGESYGQRNLVDYSPQGRKESDMTKTPTHARCFCAGHNLHRLT